MNATSCIFAVACLGAALLFCLKCRRYGKKCPPPVDIGNVDLEQAVKFVEKALMTANRVQLTWAGQLKFLWSAFEEQMRVRSYTIEIEGKSYYVTRP